MRLMRSSLHSVILLLSLSLLAAALPAGAQEHPTKTEFTTFYFTADFSKDSRLTDKNAFNTYIGDDGRKYITENIVADLVLAAEDRLRSLQVGNVAVEGSLPADAKTAGGQRFYSIEATLGITSDLKISVRYELILRGAEHKTLQRSLHEFHSNQVNCVWEELKISAADTVARNNQLENIKDAILKDTRAELMKWIVASTSRFRVCVCDSFAYAGNDTTYAYVKKLAREVVKSELSRHDAIMVFDRAHSSTDSSSFLSNLDYVITGAVGTIPNELRIDLNCVKRPSGRILSSRWAVIESVELHDLSWTVSALVRDLVQAMEMDFGQTIPTMSIVGVPKAKFSSSGEPTRYDHSLTREIVRSITQKLMCMNIGGNYADGFSFDTEGRILAGAESGGLVPSHTLNETNSDYLIVVAYQDLGEKIRLGTSLYSYHSNRPKVTEYFYNEAIHKIEIDKSTTKIVKEIAARLSDLGLTSIDTSASNKEQSDVAMEMESIRVHGVLLHRRAGFRLGGIVGRHDPELFLGRRSGNCLEAYFTYREPRLSFKREGGRWDGWLEFSVGLDDGGNSSSSGPLATLILVNYKLTATQWQYSSTAFNVSFGAGLGIHIIRYKFSPGDKHYAGDEDFVNSTAVPAYSVLGEIGVPLGTRWGIDFTVRYAGSWDTIDPIPDANLTTEDGPTGKLNAFYLLGGLSYRF